MLHLSGCLRRQWLDGEDVEKETVPLHIKSFTFRKRFSVEVILIFIECDPPPLAPLPTPLYAVCPIYPALLLAHSDLILMGLGGRKL